MVLGDGENYIEKHTVLRTIIASTETGDPVFSFTAIPSESTSTVHGTQVGTQKKDLELE